MTATPVRHPAVAGRFYPRDPEALREEVRAYLSQTPHANTSSAMGCIVPHAGYMYSGHVAGAVFRVRDSSTLPCTVPQPHRRRPSAGDHE